MRYAEIMTETIASAAALLHKKGYVEIGAGLHSIVLSNGGPFVLKLFPKHDIAYRDFVAFALTHQSPHLPNFKSGIHSITMDYCAIRVEQLTKMPQAKSIADEIEIYAMSLQNPDLIVRAGIEARVQQAVSALQREPSLFALVHDIIETLVLGKGHRIDLDHDGNIMRRGSTTVLLDPIQGSSGPLLALLR